MSATRIYLANGVLRGAAERAFWPLFFTRLVTEVDLSPFQLVLLGAIYELLIFTSEVPTGIVADVHSRRLSVIISWLVGGAAFVLSGLASPFWLLLVSQAFVGFGSTFQSGAETAWITDELGSPDEADDLILRRGQWQLVAGIGGIACFAGLAALTSLSTAIVAIGAVMIIWGLVLAVLMPETNFVPQEHEGWAAYLLVLSRGFAGARSIRPLRILLIAVLLGGVAKEALDRLDIQRLEEVGLPADIDAALVIGLMVVVRMSLAFVMVTWARRRAGGEGVIVTMAGLLIAVAIGIVVLAQADLLVLAILGVVVQGGSHMATQPLVISWTNRHADPTARATVHSFMGQAESIGEVVGGLTLGAVAELVSVSSAMMISAVLFATSAIIVLTARRPAG